MILISWRRSLSLGGGVASLLGMYLQSWFPETRDTDLIQVYAYAAPPVVDKERYGSRLWYTKADFVSHLLIINVFIALEFKQGIPQSPG
eukprot:scaffold6147_cov126-Amphora_coffeaeformis.AAC.3